MSKMDSAPRGQAFDRPTNVLLGIAARARGIRKLLGTAEKSARREAWGTLRDARRAAESIEALASYSVDLPAEDATAAVDTLEILIEQLEANAAQVLAR